MGKCRMVLLLTTAMLWSGSLRAESFRFEMGQRLRAFEASWQQQTDHLAHKRAVPHLDRAVQSFFQFSFEQCAKSLDEARFALQSAAGPEPAVRWANSLHLQCDRRLIDLGEGGVAFTVGQFYQVAEARPEAAVLHVTLRNANEAVVVSEQMAVGQLPLEGTIPLRSLAEGDYSLTAHVAAGASRTVVSQQTLSCAARLEERLPQLQQRLESLPANVDGTHRATIEDYLRKLTWLHAGRDTDTNCRAARLLAETEAALGAVAAGRAYFGQGRAGEFRLRLAGEHDRIAVRLMAPPTVARTGPLPLVIAIHGFGGSENMFFEVYGCGKIVHLCRQRGWLLLCPKSSLLGMGMTIDRIVEELGKLYPVERRHVFLVGHSMGALQALQSAERMAIPAAGVAALGGGGTVNRPRRLENTAFFVGAGTKDFMLYRARALRDSLRQAAVPVLRYKEYADIEHMMVVQTALDEVFTLFDEVYAAGKTGN